MKALGILLLMSALMTRAQEKPEVPAVPPPLEQPPERLGLEITADLTVVMLRSNMVFYSNNVVVFDAPSKPGAPATVLHCRELTASRTPSGQVDQIVAVGDVQVEQGDLQGRGQRAVYSGSNDVLVLTGAWPHEPWNSPTPLLFSTNGTLTGAEIRYERLTDKLFIPQGRTYIHQSALGGATKSTNIVRDPLLAPPARIPDRTPRTNN
jgi:hypothetical protein